MSLKDAEKKILEMFKTLDIDGDGMVTKEELFKILKGDELHSKSWTDDALNDMFDSIDVAKEGKIKIQEFVDWVFNTDKSADLLGDVGQVGYAHKDRTEIEGKLPYKTIASTIYRLELEEMQDQKEIIKDLVAKYKENWDRGLGAESFVEDTYLRNLLRNCIFVGHTNTDLDSIAGAVCAAELFRGHAARSEEDYNGEIDWALKWIGMEPPPVFDQLPGGATPDAGGNLRKVCLVDHNEVDQMTPILKKDDKRMKRIIGLIDHHAIASSFATPSPPFLDVRPWGSMSSIVFHIYLRNRVPIRKEIARLLLCAILSDTLNLKSGTTTPADRFSVAMLTAFGDVDDVDELAMKLFSAKTNWIVGLGAYEMIRGDQKNFKVGDVRYSIAVLEVTAMEPVLAIAEDILTQLRIFKIEKGDYVEENTGEKKHDINKECHCALLFVVNTVKQCSVALVSGRKEKYLMQKAFPKATWRAAGEGVRSPSENVSTKETLCDVGELVSRKLEFKPMCDEALSKDVPDWFFTPSVAHTRLLQVLNSDQVKPVSHDSVQVVWDKETLKNTVFFEEAEAKQISAKLTDKLVSDKTEETKKENVTEF